MDVIQLYQSYQDILKAELEKRQRANARYSLRAFARDLGVSPSNLSEILQRKAGLSRIKAQEIAKKLNLLRPIYLNH